MAWAQSAAIAERRQCETGGLAPCSRTSQYLGTRTSHRVLEICGAPEDRWRNTRFVCPERKQFLHAARKREGHGSGLAPISPCLRKSIAPWSKAYAAF